MEEQKVNILKCGDLTLNLKTGEAEYGEVKTRFSPGHRRYLALALFMMKPDQFIPDDDLIRYTLQDKAERMLFSDLVKDKIWRKVEIESLYYLVRDIKYRLGILKGSNPDIFVRGKGGYMAVGN